MVTLPKGEKRKHGDHLDTVLSSNVNETEKVLHFLKETNLV